MATQTVFRRYELKYMLTRQQYADLLQTMQPYMHPDHFGVTTIRNIYFDTDSYRFIRRSIEKPVYKEKLRIRSYDQATDDGTVFVEQKKKYEDVVYKRRVMLSNAESMAWLLRQTERPVDSQICREIDYFADFYGPLRPAVFLSYQRQAYYALKGNDSVQIENATTTLIASKGDCIKTTNSDISDKGNQRGSITIHGGTHTLYAAGWVVAIMPQGGMSNEATHCNNFNAVAKSNKSSLTAGQYLTLDMGGAAVTIRMPVSMSALIVNLGSKDPVLKTVSSTDAVLDRNGVCWKEN